MKTSTPAGGSDASTLAVTTSGAELTPTPRRAVLGVAGIVGALALTSRSPAPAYADPTADQAAALALKVAKGELVFNVKDYGAVGDGTTDDIAAITAALAAAVAAKGELFLPGGTYKISTPLTMAANSVTLRGAGKDSTILLFTGNGTAVTSGAGTTNYTRWRFADFTIDTRRAAANTIALDLNNVGRSQFQNLRLRCTITLGGGVGVKFTGGDDAQVRSTYYNTFIDCEISATGKSLWGVGYANVQKFYGGLIDGPGTGVLVEEGSETNNIDGWLFSGVSFATTGTDMIILGSASGSVHAVTNFQFHACRFESNAPSFITIHPNCYTPSFTGGGNSGDLTIVNNGPSSTILIPSYTKLVLFRGARAFGVVPAPQTDIITATGSWTKPTGAKYCRIIVIAGGSGGASGRQGAANTVRCGGGGGGGGATSVLEGAATGLSSTVAVTIGAGGIGGAAQTARNTGGNPGAAGGNTTFGAYLHASGAGASVGGTAALGTGGAAGFGSLTGNAGGSASTTGRLGGGGTTTGGGGGAGGGGAGGGMTAANVAGAGGAGGPNRTVGATSSAGGAVDKTAPAPGNASIVPGTPSAGAGGGAASITKAAQAGAHAVGYGGGGGGGGASLNGNKSGAGGNGAPGYCLVITTF